MLTFSVANGNMTTGTCISRLTAFLVLYLPAIGKCTQKTSFKGTTPFSSKYRAAEVSFGLSSQLSQSDDVFHRMPFESTQNH